MTAQHTVPPASRRHLRRPVWPRLASAASAVALVATMTACEKHSPIAAPTPTIAVPTESEPSPTATVPEYTTDLDLNAEEKKAVEQALVALDGYYRAMTEAYLGNDNDLNNFRRYATGSALESTANEINDLSKESPSFAGYIHPKSVSVYEIKSDSGTGDLTKVITHSCLNTTEWSFAAGSKGKNATDKKITMENTAIFDSKSWKINDQQLWSRSC